MLQAILSGILVGGVYGLFSVGFSLAFGVMRIVNFAHGELVMAGMYVGYVVHARYGIDALAAAPLAFAVVGLLGAALYVFAFRRFAGQTTLQQLLVAIAIALVLQVIAQIVFGPDPRAVGPGWGSRYLLVGSVFLSYAQIAAFAVALAAMGAIELTLRCSALGRAVRAVADDAEAAEVVGMNSHLVNLSAFAFSCALAGGAGAVLVSYYPASPVVGFSLMPVALIATVVGGLGSIGGAFLGGILCGVMEQVTSVLWTPALQDVPLYLLVLFLFAFRPNGLFGASEAHR